MEDLYYKIKKARETNTIQELVKEHNGDINLTYFTNPEPIYIKNNTIDNPNNKKDSLKYIFNCSAETNLEMAFTGIFNENERLVKDFVRGDSIDLVIVIGKGEIF